MNGLPPGQQPMMDPVMVLSFTISKYIHPIGIACSLFVVLTLLFFLVYDRSLIDRVSLRLIGMIALADICTHVRDHLIKTTPETGHCVLVSAFTYFGTYLYNFTNIAVAYNFYAIFISQKGVSFRHELKTWIAVILLAFGITGLFWLLNSFGYDDKIKKCVGNPNNAVFYVRGVFQVLLCLGTIIYCVYVVVIVRMRLKDYVSIYIHETKNLPGDSDAVQRHLVSLLKRCLIYPLAPLITQPAMIAFMTYYMAYKGTAPWIQVWLVIGYGLSGPITFISFILDLTLQRAFYTLFTRIKARLSGNKGTIYKSQSQRLESTHSIARYEMNSYPSSYNVEENTNSAFQEDDDDIKFRNIGKDF